MKLELIAKKDAVISLIIGFLIGVFFLISVRVIKIDLNWGWDEKLDWFLLVLLPVLCYLGMIFASIFKNRLLIIYQFLKFGLVGALNTFIDFGILNGLILLTSTATGIYFSIFKGISFLFAAVNSYFWNKHWTFEKKENVFSSNEFLKFIGVTLIGFLLNVGTASLIVNVVGPQYGIGENLWANIGAFAAVFVGFGWNFVGSKFIVFKK